MVGRPRAARRGGSTGFTLVELLVVLVIITVLLGLAGINLGQTKDSASLTARVNTLLADLKSQQLLAMAGDTGSGTVAEPHGIYFESGSYILFADSSYSSGDSANFVVSADPVTITTTLPGDQVVFSKGDGSVSGFTSGDDTITLSTDGTSRTITINRFGALSED